MVTNIYIEILSKQNRENLDGPLRFYLSQFFLLKTDNHDSLLLRVILSVWSYVVI